MWNIFHKFYLLFWTYMYLISGIVEKDHNYGDFKLTTSTSESKTEIQRFLNNTSYEVRFPLSIKGHMYNLSNFITVKGEININSEPNLHVKILHICPTHLRDITLPCYCALQVQSTQCIISRFWLKVWIHVCNICIKKLFFINTHGKTWNLIRFQIWTIVKGTLLAQN